MPPASFRECRVAEPFWFRDPPRQSVYFDPDQALDVLIAACLIIAEAGHLATFATADVDYGLHPDPAGDNAIDALRRGDRQVTPSLDDRAAAHDNRGMRRRYC